MPTTGSGHFKQVNVRSGKDGQMNVIDLDGPTLDYWVAKTEGTLEQWLAAGPARKKYSSEWAHGGPIVEREKIAFSVRSGTWMAWCASDAAMKEYKGPNALVAAMRCYVATRIGETLPWL